MSAFIRTLKIGCLVSLILGLGETRADLAKQLRHYWPMDGSAADLIGRGHGLPKASLATEEGVVGTAITMDGNLTCIEVAGSDENAFNRFQMAASFWVKVSGMPGTVFYTGPLAWGVFLEPPGFILGSGHVEPETLALTQDELQSWHHVVVTGSDIETGDLPGLYVDGKKLETTPGKQGFYFEQNKIGTDGVGKLYIGGKPGFTPLLRGALDEIAIWHRNLTEAEVMDLYLAGSNGVPLYTLLPDDDKDGVPDRWEDSIGLVVGVPDAALDQDNDGLQSIDEFLRASDPLQSDSDFDGILDDAETGSGTWLSSSDTGTLPFRLDSDADGLIDVMEDPSQERGTDPNIWDTDNDGFGDGDEKAHGSDPTDPASVPDIGRGLVAYWAFDDDLEDLIGPFSGEMVPESAVDRYADGMIRGALSLDGDPYVNVVADPSEFGFLGQSFSVTLWAKLDSWLPWNTIISQGAGRRWQLTTIHNHDPFRTGWDFYVPRGTNDAGQLVTGQQLSKVFHWDVTDRNWHHIAAVFRSNKGSYGNDSSGNAPTLYIDSNRIDLSRFTSGLVHSELQAGLEGVGLSIGGFPGDQGAFRWIGSLDELAIWRRAISSSEVKSIYNGALRERKSLGDLISPDSDGDRMPDWWEVKFQLDPSTPNDEEDLDLDGLTNFGEYQRFTDPTLEDTDGDGYSDLVETDTGVWSDIENTGTNPLDTDSDGDGLPDGLENPSASDSSNHRFSISDPNRIDTDDDGFTDGIESRYGTSSQSSASVPDLSDGLLAYWPFDHDLNDHEHAYHGDTDSQPEFVRARFGQGIRLNGVDQFVTITGGREDDFDFVGESFTVSLWYRVNPNRSDCDEGDNCWVEAPLVAKGLPGESWQILDRRGELLFNNLQFNAKTDPGDNVFHHTVAVSDRVRDEVRLYHDGALATGLSGKSVSFEESDSRLILGAIHQPISSGAINIHQYWGGVLDDVAVWKRPLTSMEIERLWQSDGALDTMMLDGDRDGVSDQLEAISGTDPGNNTDYFRATNLTRLSLDEFSIAWSSVPGRQYQIEWSPQLPNLNWQGILEQPLTATLHVTRVDIQVPLLAERMRGYLRVRVLP